MNSVERVRAICKERKIAISKLEKDLGFSNGYIGQLRKGVFPADRLAAIADYLSVSTEFLMSGIENEKTPALTTKDRRDIARDLELMMQQLDEGSDLMFDGDPISDEAKASIRNALQMGLEIAKVKNKERFTPKKYRKD